MAAAITIRGKDNVMNHFNRVRHPYWRVLDADSKAVISQEMVEHNLTKSGQKLHECLGYIDQSGVYRLDTFVQEKDQKFTRGDTSVIFCLSEKINEIPGRPEERKEVDIYSAASTRDHIKLITDNAGLCAEISVFKRENERLLLEIAKLKTEILELEEIIDEYEEEDEEDEANKIAGTDSLAGTFNDLLKKHGSQVIDKVVGGKGKLKMKLQEEEEENKEENPENQE